jgi:hypothetical protein
LNSPSAARSRRTAARQRPPRWGGCHIVRTSNHELLATAADATFFTGVGDLAESLSQANMAYGIAKIRFVQAQLGIEPDAHFVSAPDATITRNIARWKAGFGYGGRVRYSGDFVVMDIKSNACGLFLGRMAEIPDAGQILHRIRALHAGDTFVASTGTSWDFGKSNHFVHVLRFEHPIEGDEYGILCHGSGPELRGPGPWGPGLYLDRSPRLQELARTVATPWGPLSIIEGPEPVREYWQGYCKADAYSHARRLALAEALFPTVTTVSNLTHQGALAPNDVVIGSVADAGTQRVPLALRADLPIFLLAPRQNLSMEAMTRLGFTDRAARLGLTEQLARANVLPHGGGYALPGYRAIDHIVEAADGERIYVMEIAQGNPARAFHENFRHVPFDYRGLEVLERVVDLDMAEIANRAHPIYEFMV